MKKGFTLVELLAVIVILAIILAIAIPGISNIINSSKKQAYAANEGLLVKAAKLYTATNESALPNNVGDINKVRLEVLISQNLISQIQNLTTKENCNGYVSIKKTADNIYDYIPYLSCGSDYESEKYAVNGLIANYKFNGNANDSTLLSSNGNVYGAVLVNDRRSLNIVPNGNFAFDNDNDGIADGWGPTSIANKSVSNNIQHITANASSGHIYQCPTNTIGHIYYYSVEVKADSSLVRLNNGYNITAHSGSNNFEKLSWRQVATQTYAPHRGLYDDRTSGWTEIQVKNAQEYDLTDIFGAGNEPTKTWCDANLNDDQDKSYNFDGVDDYIELADSTNLRMASGGTITAWIYPRSLGEINYGRIADKSTNTAGGNGYLFCVYPNNSLLLQINNDITLSSANAITLNSWNYVVVTFNSLGRKIYANGVDVTLSGGNLTALPQNVAGAVYIGNRAGNTDRTFDGYIDDVRFYNRALSADEIKNNYDIEK